MKVEELTELFGRAAIELTEDIEDNRINYLGGIRQDLREILLILSRYQEDLSVEKAVSKIAASCSTENRVIDRVLEII